MPAVTEVKTKSFKTPADFRKWLENNHISSPGIWLKFYKKSSVIKTIVYKEAVDEALCFGWIDSQSKSVDDKTYVQRFTPRRPKSVWSKVNREKVARLIKEKRMTPAGLKEITAAKKDGRWAAAYDSPKTMVIPKDFLQILSKDKKAKAFFDTLSKSNLYSIGWRLQTAKKPETRERRTELIMENLRKGIAPTLF